MTHDFEAAALRLASTVQRALALTTGTDAGLTLEEAARVLGLAVPVTAGDLTALALACERAQLAVNLDSETGGEWWRLRQAAKVQVLDEWASGTAAQLARVVLEHRLVCVYCSGRRFGRAHGAKLCHGCGALTRDAEAVRS